MDKTVRGIDLKQKMIAGNLGVIVIQAKMGITTGVVTSQ